MAEEVKVQYVSLQNYKALRKFYLSIKHINILTGTNNSGKSTLVGVFKILAEGIRQGRSKTTTRLASGDEARIGWVIPKDRLSISIENVHTDYGENETIIEFGFSNKNKLFVQFASDGTCFMTASNRNGRYYTPKNFRKDFPISVKVVPILGPVDKEEKIVTPETIKKNIDTNLAPRNFRNFWFHFKENFQVFSEMVARTWPGMEVKPPEVVGYSDILRMFVTENRIDREMYWSGSGFQIWCQILTHIVQAEPNTILVVDEPEIYLHPEIQRQLLSILRELGPDIVLSTHSTEIIAEAEPNEILLVDKSKETAQRLRDVDGVQAILEAIGSIQNITLTQLARNRRIIFFEGLNDFKIIRRFSKILGFEEVFSGIGITPIESGGFSSWEKIKSTAWGIEKTMGDALGIAAVSDRDYYPEEQLREIAREIPDNVSFFHVHRRKEIENYLLDPKPLYRSINKLIRARHGSPVEEEEFKEILERISEDLKSEAQAQYISKAIEYGRKTGADSSTISHTVIKWFDAEWKTMEKRIFILPGKKFLKKLREELQQKFGVALTDIRIIDAYEESEIPKDLVDLINQIDSYRKH